jgi:hypothetical protein
MKPDPSASPTAALTIGIVWFVFVRSPIVRGTATNFFHIARFLSMLLCLPRRYKVEDQAIEEIS